MEVFLEDIETWEKDGYSELPLRVADQSGAGGTGGIGVGSPSPTRNWYSGPEGFVSTLLVSIMGAT
jgi:hypothetical protein